MPVSIKEQYRVRRPASIFCLLLLASAVTPVEVSAQSGAARAEFTGAVGVAVPSGAMSQHANVGIGGLLGVGVSWKDAPVGFRFEGLAELFPTGDHAGVCGGGQPCSSSPNAEGLAVNVLLFDSGSDASAFYFIGGAGAYQSSLLVPLATPGGIRLGYLSNSGLGWNVGIGRRIPRAGKGWHLEARYFALPVPSGSGGSWIAAVGVNF